MTNGWCQLAFPTGRDSAIFRDKGTEVPSLSRDKGTTGQAQNLATGLDGRGRAGRACQNPERGTGQSLFFCQNPGRDRDGTGQARFFSNDFMFYNIFSCFTMYFSCFRTSFLVLELPFLVLELPFPVFWFFGVSDIVPGRPGTG